MQSSEQVDEVLDLSIKPEPRLLSSVRTVPLVSPRPPTEVTWPRNNESSLDTHDVRMTSHDFTDRLHIGQQQRSPRNSLPRSPTNHLPRSPINRLPRSPPTSRLPRSPRFPDSPVPRGALASPGSHGGPPTSPVSSCSPSSPDKIRAERGRTKSAGSPPSGRVLRIGAPTRVEGAQESGQRSYSIYSESMSHTATAMHDRVGGSVMRAGEDEGRRDRVGVIVGRAAEEEEGRRILDERTSSFEVPTVKTERDLSSGERKNVHDVLDSQRVTNSSISVGGCVGGNGEGAPSPLGVLHPNIPAVVPFTNMLAPPFHPLFLNQLQQAQTAVAAAAAAGMFGSFLGNPRAAAAAAAIAANNNVMPRIALPRGVDPSSSWAPAGTRSGVMNQQPTALPRRVRRKLEESERGSREGRRASMESPGEPSATSPGTVWPPQGGNNWIGSERTHAGGGGLEGEDSSDTTGMSGSYQDDDGREDGLDADGGGGGGVGGMRDPAYYERRRKNNEAAKRSRDTRRQKEEEVAIRANQLEAENVQLKAELEILKAQSAQLHRLLFDKFEDSRS